MDKLRGPRITVSLGVVAIAAIATLCAFDSSASAAEFRSTPVEAAQGVMDCCVRTSAACCCCPAMSPKPSNNQAKVRSDAVLESNSIKAIVAVVATNGARPRCGCLARTPGDESKPTRSDSTARRTSTEPFDSTFAIVRPSSIHSFEFGLKSRIPLLGSLPEPFLRSTHLLI
jgi:hypothetical protein